MNWAQLISELASAGKTQGQIAEWCGIAQSTVSDLARGETKSPAYAIGVKLVELHKLVCVEKTDPIPAAQA